MAELGPITYWILTSRLWQFLRRGEQKCIKKKEVGILSIIVLEGLDALKEPHTYIHTYTHTNTHRMLNGCIA